MTIQRTESELIITLSSSVNVDSIQRLINLLTYQEIAAKSRALQEQADALASEANKDWWERNASRFNKP